MDKWEKMWSTVPIIHDSTSSSTSELQVDLSNIADTIRPERVNHPSHYGGKYEVIDILKDKLSTEQFYGFLCGNVMKYIMRYQKKNGLVDLKKAEWYLTYLIEEMENGQEP